MKKSINLKKQLAFISSLALIAGSAVYMPANVSEILGVGKSISVSADDGNTEGKDDGDINLGGDSSSTSVVAPNFTFDGAVNDFKLSESPQGGEGTAEKPYVYIVELASSAEYGSTMDYAFSSVENKLSAVSGSKGTVTFNSADGSATTGVFKAYNSTDKKYVYYQVKFTQNTTVAKACYDENITNTAAFTYNNNSEEKGCELKFGPSNKLEVIDGKYVKNYDAIVPATVKAKSKITVALSGFVNGYGIGTTGDKFDVTLDESGNASTIIKISSTWEDQNIVEYVKVNFALESSFDANDDALTFNNVGKDSYSADYITEGNNYVKVYTVRDEIADDGTAKVEGNNVTLSAMEGATEIIENALTFTNGTSQTAIVNKKDAPYEYIKVVYNPTYTLTFYDVDGTTVLATQEETVGGTYTLPEAPTKEGYTFAGWTKENKDALYAGMDVAQSDGIKAYATWNPISYTVKVDANGGTAETDSTKLDTWNISSYGTSVQLSNVAYNTTDKTIASGTTLVSRAGYELIGFSTDKNATTPDENLSFLDSEGKIKENGTITLDKLTSESGSTVTLYAVWRAESKTVIFDKTNVITAIKDDTTTTDDESAKQEATVTLEMDEDLKVATDAKLGTLPTPTLKGYTFKGWYYNTAGTGTANWVQATADTVATADVLSYISGNGAGLVAYFTQNTYAINYDDCGTENTGAVKFGYTLDGETQGYDAKGNEADYLKLNEKPEKEGYEFVGYTINGIVKDDFAETKDYFKIADISSFLNGTELSYKTDATKTEKLSIGESDVTIKALWKVDTNSSIINVDYDDAIITYTNPETGATIKVKPTSSSYTKFPAEISGKPGERISYDCEIDGDNGDDNKDYITFTDYGFDVDDVECRLSKEGYVFAGWFTKDADGKETAFTNTKFTAGVTDVYAKWEAESKLTAPTNVKVAEDGTVSWTAAEGVDHYRVFKVYNGITRNALVAATATSYKFQNLAEGVEHKIYVVAYDGNGNTVESTAVMFTPAKKAVLTAPTNVKVDANGKVTWTAAENAAYYKVSKVVNGKTSTGKQVTGTEYTFQYLAKGQKHEIYVTAFDKDGNSLKSEAITVTPMAAPANVAVSEDGTVTWTKSEGAAYYRVYKKYGKTTKNAKVAATATSYTFQNLTEGVKHEIYVIAFDADGNQYKSESVMFTPEKKATLTAPTNVKVDADGNVTWTAAENAAYYKVSKVVGGKTYTGKQITDTKYTFLSFNPGQNKVVYVTAFDKDGNSIKSEEITIKAVENIKVTTAGVVTFDKVDGASYYKVFKEYGNKTKSAKTTASPYTFQTFTKGVKHDVYVKAYDASGNEIAVSKTVTVTAE